MRIALVNPISQTPPSRRVLPRVYSNRQSIGVQMARQLQESGHDCRVVMAGPYRPEIADEGVESVYLDILRTPLTPPTLVPWMRGLSRFVTRGAFDAVLSSEVMQWSTAALCRASARGGPPVFVWQETDCYPRFAGAWPARAYFASLGRWVLHEAVGLLPRSEPARRFLLEQGAAPHKLGPELPNPVDAKVFRPLAGRRDPRPLVLHVGTFLERKDPLTSLRAFSVIHRSRPDARLLMKGSGEMEERLRQEIRTLGLEGVAHLDTARSTPEEMAELYNRSWVALFPTSRDLATLSPVEALACGVPAVISGRLSHSRALRRMGAVVADAETPEAFASQALQLIQAQERGLDPGPAVERLLARYSLESCAFRLADYMQKTIDGGVTRAHPGR